MDLAFREFVGDNICAIDLTPMPGIDDLLQPLESIKEAQELAAEAWGADHTFFLINGSTSGNQCMMMTAVNPGDEIAVPRNSHKSMLGGLVMSGARADLHAAGSRRRAAHGSLRDARDRRAHARRASRARRGLPRLADVLRRRRRSRGDRAHRARRRQTAARRRGVGTALPLSSGAAALGDGGRRRSLHQLDAQDALGVLAVRDAAPKGRSRAPRPPQSGAQDVPLDVAESADGRVARRRAQTDGDRGRGAALAHDRARAGDAPRASIESTGSTASATSCRAARASSISIRRRSPSRSRASDIPGYEASEILRRRYNIQVELADLFNVVALFTIGTTPDAADRLVDGLRRDGARRPPGRYVRALGNSRAPAATRKLPACRRFRRCACCRATHFSPTPSS